MDALGLTSDGLAQCLLPDGSYATLENMILKLRELEILAEDLADRLFVLALQAME